MNVSEIAARNRKAKLEQLARLQPSYQQASQTRRQLREIKQEFQTTKTGVELMSKLKRIPGFFPTPREIVERMIEVAEIPQSTNVDEYSMVLEPSAGKGNIIEVLRDKFFRCDITAVEINGELVNHLRDRFGTADVLHADFMECFDTEFKGAPLPVRVFDFVLMNPPFENRQDIRHVEHAFKFLKSGGRLVAIVSSTSGQRLEQWAADRGGYVEPLPPNSFATSERPTGVNCSMVVANK